MALISKTSRAEWGSCRTVTWVTNWGWWVAAFLLVLTASLKIIYLLKLDRQSAKQLLLPSIVFPFLTELLLIKTVIGLEYVVVIALAFTRKALLRFSIITWLSCMFIAYHFSLYMLAEGIPCHCMGSLHIGSERALNWVGLVLLGILLCVGVGGLATHAWPSDRLFRVSVTRKKVSSRLLSLCFYAATAAFATASAAPGWVSHLEVKLRISETNLSAAAHPTVTTWNVRCVLGTNDWFLEHMHTPNALNTYFPYGSNVLQITRLTSQIQVSEQIKQLLPSAIVKTLNHTPSESDWDFLTISPGELPLDDIGVQLPWLALCSGSYLRGKNRLLPLPSAMVRFAPGAFGYRDETQTFRDTLGLPNDIRFIASTRLFASAMRDKSLVRVGMNSGQIRRAVNPHTILPDGFVRASYQVLSHTNVIDWTIPTRFLYEEFVPGKESNLLVRAAGGVVEAIEAAPAPTMNLSQSDRYSVADYRFRHSIKLVDQIHYAITNGKIPPTSNPALQRLFKKYAAAAPYDPVLKAHLGIYVVFATLLIGPVIVATRWLRRQSNTKQ